MFVLRPIEKKDLEALYQLSLCAETGLTTLPQDKGLLASRLEESLISFSKQPRKPGGEYYLFVLEDLEQKRVVGTSGLFSKVGGYEPFYTYQIKVARHQSKALKVDKKIEYLQLLAVHDGPSEIGTLFLHPEYRKKGLGRLLSLGRFMYVGQYPGRFEEEFLAELRGVVFGDRSPFWEGLGVHFFQMEYPKADAMVMQSKRFIADLMPAHPIYIPLLPKEARDVIGEVHQNTRGARVMLESEGFRFINQVDIFEGGPVLQASKSNIRTIVKAKEAVLRETTRETIDSVPFLISRVEEPFRALQGTLSINPGRGVRLHEKLAEALGVKPGDPLRYVAHKPLASKPKASHKIKEAPGMEASGP